MEAFAFLVYWLNLYIHGPQFPTLPNPLKCGAMNFEAICVSKIMNIFLIFYSSDPVHLINPFIKLLGIFNVIQHLITKTR